MATYQSRSNLFFHSPRHAIIISVILAVQIVAASIAATTSLPDRTSHVMQAPFSTYFRSMLQDYFHLAWTLTTRKYERIISGHLNLSDMVQLATLCCTLQCIRVWRQRPLQSRGIPSNANQEKVSSSTKIRSSSFVGNSTNDPESTDPGLLKKHSKFNSYTTSYATYPSIRKFYRPHPQAEKLPSRPTPLPLLVFIHGLGGSLAQFNSLINSLANVGPCLGIDLPGCGRSAFAPTSWNAYSIKALAELLCAVIRQHCAQDLNQGVILVGHSMGCSLSVLVASQIQSVMILGLVAISPQAEPPSDDQGAKLEKLLMIPTPIFNLWRTWDRRGGPNSASVARFVGKEADIEVKRLQERFNAQSQTDVWRRMARGALPSRHGSSPERGLPGLDAWGNLRIPVFLVGGEGDCITKVDQIIKISKALGKTTRVQTKSYPDEESANTHVEATAQDVCDSTEKSGESTTEITLIGSSPEAQSDIPSYTKTRQVLKTSILPPPASHGLLYDPATYRTLAGLIHTFLHDHIDTRLSLGWQLQHLATEGKWDVKNLAKWQAVRPISEPIAGIFRAMKTLREIDEVHSPEIFVNNWRGKIKAVIDISHESPVYDPKGLDEGGIEYHKFPTVSKIPPTPEEVQEFIKLVDRLRTSPTANQHKEALIGVHCHYGFNRTGFFICCYLIENEGFGVQQAVDEFARARPPGVRHEHFLDMLWVRYCAGLKKAPTL